MTIERVEIGSVFPDPGNCRAHPERNLEAIKTSLIRFSQQRPIVVDRDGKVIAGNGTLAAAKSLGWDHIDVVRTSLTAKDASAFAISDNQSATLAEWNLDTLVGFLSDTEIGDVGFTDDELRELFREADGLNEQPPSHLNVTGDAQDGDKIDKKLALQVTANQREVIDRGIARFREMENDPELSEGRCLELIVADWTAGN